MIRLTKLRKAIAMFFLINIVFEIVAPHVSYALTAGPTAPEATSFEPVDTTDMVNLLSGDLAYNIPLLEVPGPEGGYPLSLSYHAGIQPNEEASWVGLGWTLNPGAITRNVNGYPDDALNSGGLTRNYIDLGIRRTSSIGVSVGLTGLASVSAGLSFSQDTYLGFGMGGYIGAGVGLLKNSLGGINAGIQLGINPYGGAYLGVGLGAATSGAMSLGTGVGISTNFETIGFSGNASVSYDLNNGAIASKSGLSNGMSANLLGVSIASGGSKPLLTVGGLTSSLSSNTMGNVHSETLSSFNADIPVFPGVNLSFGYSKTRSWYYEESNVQINGVLNFPKQKSKLPANFENTAYDTYHLYEGDKNIVDNPRTEEQLGGSFPDNDNYFVVAQGVSGSIKPYALQEILVRQSIKTEDKSKDRVTSIALSNGLPEVEDLNKKVQFRFANDFSNQFRQNNFNLTQTGVITNAVFDNNPTYGNIANSGFEGYNSLENKLAGSKHIEWFTNKEIIGNSTVTNGFVNTTSKGFQRLVDDQIGGFMITNESGVTYHYALPAYSYNELQHTDNINRANTYNEVVKYGKYAYTWYLTAITGPDYVDRGQAGLDEEDWGYWVSFDYGLWVDNYQWRNPSEGYNVDDDQQFKTYSKGSKELYYLNTIRTRTHTAFFEKEIRADGKGYPYIVEPASDSWTIVDYYDKVLESGQNDYAKYPSATLRLNKIYLLNNSDVKSIGAMNVESRNTTYDHNFVFKFTNSGMYPITYSDYPVRVHYGNNIIDKYDIVSIPELKNKSIRIIDLSYDYSSCPQTTNSKDSEGKLYSIAPDYSVQNQLLGKLTLKSVNFLGKGGTNVTPPTRFTYDLADSRSENASITSIIASSNRGQISSLSGSFNTGDIITFTQNSKSYYATITKSIYNQQLGNTQYDVVFNGQLPTTGLVSLTATKNPPYNKDFFDMWGMYKGDFIKISNNENLSRITTPTSAKGTDVWSLHKIQSSLGSITDIVYESDTYSKSVLNENKSLIVNSTSQDNNLFKIYIETNGYDLTDILKEGDLVNLLLFIEYKYDEYNSWGEWVRTVTDYTSFNSKSKGDPLKILQVTNNSISFDYSLLNGLIEEIIPAGDSWHVPNGPYTVVTGNISFSNLYNNYGGGLRVKSISVHDQFNDILKRTNYTYTKNNSQQSKISSGVTSYLPTVLDQCTLPSDLPPYHISNYKGQLYDDVSVVLSNSRIAPAPGIMYENVKVEEEVQNKNVPIKVLGAIEYNFQVFNKNMLGINSSDITNTSSLNTKKVYLRNFCSRIGNVKRITYLDDKGNKLSETINNYLDEGIEKIGFDNFVSIYNSRLSQFNHQGLIQEVFGEGRKVLMSDGSYITKAVMSSYEEYPNVQTGSTTINYKTNQKSSSKSLEFDFYTGIPTKQLIVDEYGNRFMSQLLLAYRKYPSMGIKVNSRSNAHMLSQSAANYVYKVDINNNLLGFISGEVDEWSTLIPRLGNDGLLTTFGPSIWRKKSNYKWLYTGVTKDGITPLNQFSEFNFEYEATNNANWIKNAEVTLYNVYSNALEVKDMNGNYAATKMGYNNSKVIVSGGPCRYNELAFSGAEEMPDGTGKFSGNVTKGNGVISTAASHTGTQSLKTSYGQQGFGYTLQPSDLTAGKDYTVSVWVKNGSAGVPTTAALYYRINSGALVYANTGAKKADDWYLITLRIPGSVITAGATLQVGCVNNATSGDVYFDDFRFQPMVTRSMAYVYDVWTGELSYILDNNNLYTKYEYDEVGRLKRVSRETLGYGVKKVSENDIHYQQSIQ